VRAVAESVRDDYSLSSADSQYVYAPNVRRGIDWRHTAEAEALGFNAARLHPDIYMNELLQGMRIIHQVLPAIMKKLGMDEQDFALDRSELFIKESSSVADGGADIGHGDDADQAATDLVEPRPDDKKDTDKTPDNI
jgi:hypothetical protein